VIGQDQGVETQTAAAETFERYRRLLFSIAYRMLGSAADAEDVVQDCFVRWLQAGEVAESPKAYLSAIGVRLCIDRLRSARAQREVYVGPWLPEPIPTADQPDLVETAALAESLSLAFLVLLERLNPVERAVFLLRDVFDYRYDEIAAIVGRSEANCRQIHHRARQQIETGRPRFAVSDEEPARLTEEFLRASAEGDVDRLVGMLAEDVVFTGDGGGKMRTALKQIRGADKVVRGLVGGIRWLPPGTQARLETINGQPGILLHVDGEPVQAVVLGVEHGRITRIDAVLNPDKLRAFTKESPLPLGEG
jgi:RNA polymerase sigma-70 factor (ECF subfamily)